MTTSDFKNLRKTESSAFCTYDYTMASIINESYEIILVGIRLNDHVGYKAPNP